MQPLQKSIILCLILTVQISDGFSQYKLLVKGERNPFDSAVAVRLDRYREESKKMSLGDSLISSFKTYSDSLTSELKLTYKLISTVQEENKILIESNDRKTEMLGQMKGSIDDLLAIIRKKDKNQNKFLIIAGAVILTITILK